MKLFKIKKLITFFNKKKDPAEAKTNCEEEFLYEIDKEAINEYPLLSFTGKIRLIETYHDLHHLEKIKSGMIIGFDSESRPSFNKGEHYPISLIQLATETEAFLIRINKINYPPELTHILANPSITKIGLGLKGELRDIEKYSSSKCVSFIDLETIARKLRFKQRGVRALAGFFFKGRISKKAQKSNWEKFNLSESQILYAATDAWVVLKIYREMIKRKFI